MKIDKVIHSCDSNRFYLDFWPLVSKVWKKKFNIEPVLVFIGNEDIEIDDTYGTVIRMGDIKSIPKYLQALWVRYWLPVTEPDTTWMISDIDMFPISEAYFVDQIADIDDDKYVHLYPCVDSYGTLPSCYHIAKGSKFKEVLDLPDSWEESVSTVYNSNLGHDPGHHLAGKTHWFADEKYAHSKLSGYSNQSDLVLIPREHGRRIDRAFWNYHEKLVREGWYFDSHSIRPYEQYKDEIDKLVSLILDE